jgi:hypothetical protein
MNGRRRIPLAKELVKALIQSGVNIKVAQTLAGHHSAAFTLDQYADAVPHQFEEAGEKVASLLLAASGSILARPDGLFGAGRASPLRGRPTGDQHDQTVELSNRRPPGSKLNVSGHEKQGN